MYPYLVLDRTYRSPDGSQKRLRIVATSDAETEVEELDGNDALGAERWQPLIADGWGYDAIHLLTNQVMMGEAAREDRIKRIKCVNELLRECFFSLGLGAPAWMLDVDESVRAHHLAQALKIATARRVVLDTPEP